MRYLFKSKSLTFFAIAAFLVGGFFVVNSARAYTLTEANFKAFDGVDIATNSYTVSSGITATYIAGTGTLNDPVNFKLTGYAPIVIPWFGKTYTTYNYVTVGIKLPTDFAGTPSVYQTGIIRNDSPYNGVSYKMSTIGDGSTPLATDGAAVGYLDFSFAANSTNTKKEGLVKLQVIWNATSTPEYFTIDINGLQAGPVFNDKNTNGIFDSGELSFNTIQAAITAASTSTPDTINVAAGTYNESLNITKPVTLQSIGGRDVTTIKSLTIAASNVTVNGFTIDGVNASNVASANILLNSGVSDITISNNKIINVGSGDDNVNGDSGIGLLTTSDLVHIGDNLNVTGNIFQALNMGSNRAFFINPGINHFTFSGNTITGNFTHAATTQAENGLVENNTITGAGAVGSRSAGFRAWGYPDPTVWGHTTFSGNTVSGAKRGITADEANNVTITGNTLSGNEMGVWVTANDDLPFDITTISVHNNNLSGEDALGFGVINDTATATKVDASSNWWGTASSTEIAAKVSGSVTYNPYYIDDTSTTTNVELINAKTSAKGELDSYVSLSSYRIVEQTDVTNAISAGKTAIDGAGTLGDVATALANAKSAIDLIKTDATLTAEEAVATLATYKTTKLGELATAFGTYSSENYTTENWTTLSGFDTAGITAINSATDLAGVDTALATATAGMDEVQVLTPVQQYATTATTILDSDTTSVVLDTGSGSVENIIIPDTIPLTQEITLDMSSLLVDSSDSVTLGGNDMTLERQGTNNYSALLPAGTIITGDSNWDGNLILPTITTLTSSSGTVNVAIEMGSTQRLNFSNAVKIILGGMAGKSALYSDGTGEHTIPACTDASDTTAGSLTSGECSISVGSDLIIWTYHFTTFAAYTPTPAPSTGGGGGYVQATCSNVTYGEWGTSFNGLQYRTVLSQTPSNCSLSSSQIAAESRPYVASVEPVSSQVNPVMETPAQTSTVTQQVLGVKKYADGTLLRGTDNRIYVLIGGKLQYIPTLKELAKYKGAILRVTNETIASFAKTAVLGVKKYANGTLIKAKGDAKIYVIKDGKKMHIKSLAELKQYKGKTLTVEASELNNY